MTCYTIIIRFSRFGSSSFVSSFERGIVSLLQLQQSQPLMKPNGKLQAWTERDASDRVIAAFIGATDLPSGRSVVADRAPAMQIFSSTETARQWVEREASALGLPVEWIKTGSHDPGSFPPS